MLKITKETRDILLEVAKTKKIYVEGNFLKILTSPSSDKEFTEYLEECKRRDNTARRKRLDVTKQVQSQNIELESAAKENERVNRELVAALSESKQSANEAQIAKSEAEKLRDSAMEDLDSLQKRTQFELMGKIVKVALWVILGVGSMTTVLFAYVLVTGTESSIVESTWSNMFGILLTNSFSIIGTIMGVKYAGKEK